MLSKKAHKYRAWACEAWKVSGSRPCVRLSSFNVLVPWEVVETTQTGIGGERPAGAWPHDLHVYRLLLTHIAVSVSCALE